MALEREHAVAFDVYSLFCHYLVDQLDSLRLACSEGKLDLGSCIERIEGCFSVLFENSIPDRSVALDRVSDNLNTVVRNTHLSNAEAAQAIAAAREMALESSSCWSYTDAMEIYHEQGRNLAVLFFENSPRAETKQRLQLRATLNYQFGRARAAQERANVLALPASPLKDQLLNQVVKNQIREAKEMYKGLPGALYTFQGRKGTDYSISIPFTPNNGLMLYASYPFLFMHEYTAHIFARDYFNDRFNDGWMLYAASQYLVERWVRAVDSRLSVLKNCQAYAFNRYLGATLLDQAPGHRDSAESFYHFVREWDPSRFEKITYELAAYEPKGKESDKWPTYALKQLAEDEIKDPAKLKRRLCTAGSLDALYPGLKLKHPTIGGV